MWWMAYPRRRSRCPLKHCAAASSVDTKYVDKRPTAGFEVGFGLVDVDRRDEAGELQFCLEAEYITSTIEHLIQTGPASRIEILRRWNCRCLPDYVGVPAF